MPAQSASPVVNLLPPLAPEPLPQPDPSGQQVLQAVRGRGNLVVLGAAGTGKTTLALHALVEAVGQGRDAVLLAPTRARADRLRQRAAHLLAQVGQGSGEVRVRTPVSLAQSILTTFLTRRPDPLPPPVLLTGTEEDTVLAQMVRAVEWPGLAPEAVGSRALRSELRNLLARAGELGVGAAELRELGQVLQVPVWEPVSALLRTWDAQGRASAARRSQVRKMDSVRLQDRAAEALRDWDREGVLEARPVPALVLVDDYQDCTAATARLLAQLAQPDPQGRCSQVVVLGDPDVAVETFRGGSPSLLEEARSSRTLTAQRLVLGTRHRGSPALLKVWQDQAARVPVTGSPAYRQAPLPGVPDLPAPSRRAGQAGQSLPGVPEVPEVPAVPDRDGQAGLGVARRTGTPSAGSAQDGAPHGVSVLLASSPVQEAAQVARTLRAEHVHHGTAWSSMAVVVRSAKQVRAVAGELRRRGVPLAASQPAVLLRAEPAAAALLDVVQAAVAQQLGRGSGSLPEHAAAMALLGSPLVGLSSLDLRRLRRHLRQGKAVEASPDQYLLETVSSPEAAARLAQEQAGSPLRHQCALVWRAAQVIAALRQLTAPAGGTPQADGLASAGGRHPAGVAAQGGGEPVPALVWEDAAPAPAGGGAQGSPEPGLVPLGERAATALGAADVATALSGNRPDPAAGGAQRALEAAINPSQSAPAGGGAQAVEEPAAAPGPDVEALLWAAWEASGCAAQWQATALGLTAPTEPAPTAASAPAAPLSSLPSPQDGRVDPELQEAAEHDLDVVTTLFKRAEVWAERHPGARAQDFLAEVAAEALPSDSVAPQGIRPDGVQVLTPASAAGGQWELVAVMGVERDAWPDLRLRDSLTRSGLLVDAVTGRLPLGADGTPRSQVDPVLARAQVRGDERRMLLAALTRARRRLLVTAVSDAEHAPSSFLLEIAQAAGTPVLDDDGQPLLQEDVGDLTLRGLVAELRHHLLTGALPQASATSRDRAQAAAKLLADLADQGVPGAAPEQWLGLQGPTSQEPLVASGQTLQVSPSAVEGLTQCPLRWFLQRHGAGAAPSVAQRLGDLVHQLAQEQEEQGLGRDGLLERFQALLPTLGYPATWLGQVAADHAREVVERLATYLESVPEPALVEQEIGAELLLEPAAGSPGAPVPVRVSGRIDRLERLPGPSTAPQGKVRLIDLKTGQRVYSESSRHPQLATYRLALEANGYEVDGAALVLLGKEPRKRDGGLPALEPPGAALDPSPDPDSGQDWARELLREAALAASGPTLLARSGEQCRSCAVKDSCPIQPEGRRTIV